jgi:hypothetical protein
LSFQLAEGKLYIVMIDRDSRHGPPVGDPRRGDAACATGHPLHCPNAWQRPRSTHGRHNAVLETG